MIPTGLLVLSCGEEFKEIKVSKAMGIWYICIGLLFSSHQLNKGHHYLTFRCFCHSKVDSG